MDKLKGLSKGGWHPPGDRAIHRDSWKSDLMNRGKQKDPDADKRESHVSRPLGSLQDPASFAPPPKHSAYYGPDAPPRPSPTASTIGSSQALTSRASTASSSGGGWGAAIPAPTRRPTQQDMEEEAPKPPPEPYRRDTTGLRTDNLPKPPVRRNTPGSPAPAPPPRAKPGIPPRNNSGPPPILPPRQTEYPDEHTPAPPPPYAEVTMQTAQPQAQPQSPAMLNQGSLNRLGQAGISMPGFGIGNSNATPTSESSSTRGHAGQLNELQQRFARLGTNNAQTPPPAQSPAQPSWQQRQQQFAQTASSAFPSRPPQVSSPTRPNPASGKKAPPPPPAKKPELSSGSGGGPAPPPIPTSSKPRPT